VGATPEIPKDPYGGLLHDLGEQAGYDMTDPDSWDYQMGIDAAQNILLDDDDNE
jgi:hypothetical protein